MNIERSEKQSTIRYHVANEVRDYLFISFYLWICFSALIIFETSVLRAENLPFLPLGTALIKALIIGKFILIGKAIQTGAKIKPKVLLHKIVWRALTLLMVLIFFTAIEDLAVGLFHGHSAAAILTESIDHSWLQKLAPCAIMLLVLIPLITFEEVDQILGKGSLKRILFDASESSK